MAETEVQRRIVKALSELLEYKHLYQSVQVNAEISATKGFEAAAKVPRERAPSVLDEMSELQKELRAVLEENLGSISGSQSVDYSLQGGAGGVKSARLRVLAPDLKLYCSAPCQRLEPFHATDCTAVFSCDEPKPKRQIFAVRYMCQSCRGEPTVFLVRRQGLKLTLAGRSPIEHVNVPQEIPSPVKSYYSGAVVAHQSGQTLAGNFMLRTLVEQWMREFSPTAVMRADEALNSAE